MAKKIINSSEQILLENKQNNSSSKKSEESMTAFGHTAWKYKLQGYSYVEIGKILGISTTLIKNYIKSVHEEYKDEIWHDVEEFKQNLVMQVMYMGNETMKLWEEAKRDQSVSVNHIAYLENSRKMIKDVRDMLGLDSPKRTEVEISTGDKPYTITLNLDGSTN